MFCQEVLGHLCPFLSVANLALGLILKGSADVVKIGSGRQDFQIGPFHLTDVHTQSEHTFRVFPVVAAPSVGKLLPGKRLDVFDGLHDERFGYHNDRLYAMQKGKPGFTVCRVCLKIAGLWIS
jgi:hypothetical protein